MIATEEPPPSNRKPRKTKLFSADDRRVIDVPFAQIRPAPENDYLYGCITPEQVKDLVPSIRDEGILEPLRISRDGIILSGHRRYRAAEVVGLAVVPVVVADVLYGSLSTRERMKLLAAPNKQRVKSFGTQVKEAALDVDADEAVACHAAFRDRDLDLASGSELVVIKGERKIATISWKKRPLADAIVRLVRERGKFWPITLRAVHYALCHDGPLTDASSPTSRYRNDKKCYGILKRILKPARLSGEVPMQAINDPTRPSIEWQTWWTPGEFLHEEFDRFLNGYARNLLQSQPNHVELIVEKNSVLSAVQPVACDFRVPVTSGRGYPSLPAINEIVARYKRSGKQKLVMLVLSDHDPEGFDIANSLMLDVRDCFGVTDVEGVRLGLTLEQIRDRNLPHDLDAKPGSSRYKPYVAATGTTAAYELEAIEPADLAQIAREGIEGVLDLQLYNAEVAAHRRDAQRISGLRAEVLDLAQDAAYALDDFHEGGDDE